MHAAGERGSAARELAGFASGRNSNPEFGADGSLYFLATPDGIPNVYRLQNPSRGGTAVARHQRHLRRRPASRR